MNESGKVIRAILFDMDGVLLDSKEAWYRTFSQVEDISREEFEEKYWGRSLLANLKDMGQEQEHFCNVLFPKYSTNLAATLRNH